MPAELSTFIVVLPNGDNVVVVVVITVDMFTMLILFNNYHSEVAE